MADDSPNLPARYANGRFGPGNPGRPVGAYGRASRGVGLKILEHFGQNQERVLNALSKSDFLECQALYLKLVSRVLPRPVDGDPKDAPVLSEDELAAAVGHAHVLFHGGGDRQAAFNELESILLGENGNAAGDR